jgi:hypothetical protein
LEDEMLSRDECPQCGVVYRKYVALDVPLEDVPNLPAQQSKSSPKEESVAGEKAQPEPMARKEDASIEKSLPLAIGLNIFLPGLGYIYMGRPSSLPQRNAPTVLSSSRRVQLKVRVVSDLNATSIALDIRKSSFRHALSRNPGVQRQCLNSSGFRLEECRNDDSGSAAGIGGEGYSHF